MQVAAEERKNTIQEVSDIPEGLDRLDLIMEADERKRQREDAEIEEGLGLGGLEIQDEPFGPDGDPYAHLEIPEEGGPEPWFRDDDDEEGGELPPYLDPNREHWRAFDGFPNYEVSSHGRVRNVRTGRVRRTSTDKYGYETVVLSRRGRRKNFFVHRLVAVTWIPNPDHKPQVDHIDGDKENNILQNLRWCTAAENAQNRRIHRNNTSGYKGVWYENGRWRARITVNGRRINLGSFKNKSDAVEAYRRAAPEHHGDFGRLE